MPERVYTEINQSSYGKYDIKSHTEQICSTTSQPILDLIDSQTTMNMIYWGTIIFFLVFFLTYTITRK